MNQRSILYIAILVAALSCPAAFAHSELEKPMYIAADGVDAGRCHDPAAPCRTIGYALDRVGKGGQIRIAGGRYEIANAEDVFHIVSGVVDVRGGFRSSDRFQEPGNEPTILIGVPPAYRGALAAQGFHAIADRKGIDAGVHAKTEALLAQKARLQSGLLPDPCVGGTVGGMACDQVDLLAHLPLQDVSANPSRTADVWGFVDLNSNREYVIIGFRTGTGVFDVTDPENPREIGFVDGQATVWRDVKVHQSFNPAADRWEAYAYVTTDGAGDGLFVIDLTQLPHRISRRNFNSGSEFSAAHNVYAANADFGTGLSITGDAPSLIIAGSNNGGGRFRSYSLANPGSPSFTAMPGNGDYMHDAASMIIYDQRKDTQCVNAGDYCEILFDFNETEVDIWDITNGSNPVRLSRTSYANARYTHSGWPSEDKQFLFVHDELDEQNVGLQTTVRTLSLANLGAPTLVNIWSGPRRAIDHNGFVRGNRYYMSNYTRGLTILDISDATAPVAVGHFDTSIFNDNSASFAGAWGVYPFLHSGNIAVADIEEGLYMLADRTLDVAAGTISLDRVSYGIDEGQNLSIGFRRAGGSVGDVGVNFEFVAATADNDDIGAMFGSFTWSDGDAFDKGFGVTFQNDGVAEGMERLIIRLVAPSGGATISGTTTASIYISDPGAVPLVEFDQDSIYVAERGFGTAVAVLQRRDSAVGAASVDYTMVAGDATAGSDFQGATTGTVSWADGDADPKWIEFPITDDGSGEADEFFELALSNPSGATIGASSTLRIDIADGIGSNQAPNAVAGVAQTVMPAAAVTLDGGQSNDPDGDALTYQWTQVMGPSVALDNDDTAVATFTAPNVKSSTLLRFELAVTDPLGFTDTATANVTVSTSTGGGGLGGGGGGGASDWWLILFGFALLVRRRGIRA